MINQFFAHLNRGVSNEYGRFVEPSLYKRNTKVDELHALLVPSADDKFSSMCTEQLLQYVKQSSYIERLQELDPVNTYSRDILVLTDNSYTVVNSEDIEVIVLNENLGNSTWSEKSFTVLVNPITLEATVSTSGLPSKVYEFTMTDNLSSKILLADKIYVRFKGTLPTSSFTISVRYSQRFNRDMAPIATAIDSIAIPWYDANYTRAYQTSKSLLDKVAILTMNLYEILNAS